MWAKLCHLVTIFVGTYHDEGRKECVGQMQQRR